MYTPSNIDELEHVPVVFVLHGSGGGPNEIAEQTGWRLFAEEAGVVLVVPQGSVRVPTAMTTKNGVEYFASGNSWTVAATASAPNDLLFFDYLYDWIQKDYAYADKLDMSRCYVSGQSMGGSCTNNLINYRPQYFAAAAPCSWVFSGKPDSVTAYDIPVVNCMGQKDTTIPGAFSKETGKTAFDYFINRYQLTEKGGKNRTWEDFTWLTNDAVCTEEYKALNLYIYETAKQYPMFIAIEGQGMGHATSCTQVEYIWNTVFSHYTRDPETKVLYYDGDVVDTPVNLALAEKAAK
jgi:poly(3-hydroxybutyrate) depolymerase